MVLKRYHVGMSRRAKQGSAVSKRGGFVTTFLEPTCFSQECDRDASQEIAGPDMVDMMILYIYTYSLTVLYSIYRVYIYIV